MYSIEQLADAVYGVKMEYDRFAAAVAEGGRNGALAEALVCRTYGSLQRSYRAPDGTILVSGPRYMVRRWLDAVLDATPCWEPEPEFTFVP